jgi:hypothetical protein
MRPRPVAQFEPLASTLPVWSPAAATTPTATPTMAAQTTPLTSSAAAPGVQMPPVAAMPGESARIAASDQPPARSQSPTTPIARRTALAERAEERHASASGYPTSSAGQTQPIDAGGAASQAASPALQALASQGGPATAPTAAPVAPTLLERRQGSVVHASAPLPTPVSPLSAVAMSAFAASRLADEHAPAQIGAHSVGSTAVTPPTLAQQRAGLTASTVADDSGESKQVRVLHPSRLPDGTLHTASVATEGNTPPAPVVRVTIGRIVIKAEPVKPEQRNATPARQPVTPALSLDQYLKGRNGGGE